jgi:IS30 family transposase
MNGLLRDCFPKGTDLGIHPPGHRMAVENEFNKRPGECWPTGYLPNCSPPC